MFLKFLTNKEVMPKFIEINGTNSPCEKHKLLGIIIDLINMLILCVKSSSTDTCNVLI